jgi:biopolymer transport protein ExbD
MRIRVRPTRRRAERITLHLASMVDVVFLLLIYFMVTTVLTRPEDRLSSLLQTQRSGDAAASDFEPQILDVVVRDGSPVYQIGSAVARTRGELGAALAGMHRPSGLFVRVADNVPVGFAVGAIQAGRDAGFEKVTYVPAK